MNLNVMVGLIMPLLLYLNLLPAIWLSTMVNEFSVLHQKKRREKLPKGAAQLTSHAPVRRATLHRAPIGTAPLGLI
jgi:hypothetical protein